MALGGGTFTVQNKGLPGAYINFVSASSASSALSDRGIATMPLELDWGMDNSIFTVSTADFKKNSLKLFGYVYDHEKLRGLRDLFLNIKMGHFFKLNSGTKAANIYATANCTGIRGNALKIVIEASEDSNEETPKFDVSTILDSTVVDIQKGISAMSELIKNDFVTFISTATIGLTAGTPLSGGTNGVVENSAYQAYLDKVESYSFNTMGCLSTDDTIQALFVNYTKRMRDERGVKFQTVLFRVVPDYEGVISVRNGSISNIDGSDLIYWATGAEAGCAVNRSLTNALYDGELEINTEYTQTELENGIKAGELMFHRVGDEVRVLEDVNTFISVTNEKSGDFSSNQTIRVLDQIGNDIATLFNTKYLGQMPNDAAGRISLWNDIVKHHQDLQTIRAIENFSGDDVTVDAGDSKKSVVVMDSVTTVNAMTQLYMMIIIQ